MMRSESSHPRRRWLHLLSSLFALFAGMIQTNTRAHSTGENYVFIAIEKQAITGQFEIHLNDLAAKLGLKPEAAGVDAARKMIEETAPKVEEYIRNHFSLNADGQPLEIRFTRRDLLELPFGIFGHYYFEIPIRAVPDELEIDHRMLYENDRYHRGLLVLTSNARTGTEYPPEHATMVFSRQNPVQTLDLTKEIQGLMRVRQFVWQGVLHIWIGIDHILFLIVLLLPAVLRRENGEWLPAENFAKPAWKIVRIVTIFTIAHTITLSLSALDIFALPSRVVESFIAASIVFIAVNNIFPRFRDGSALVIFFFGLFHGMGFATVMGALPFRMENVVKVLFCFNVGVELGQLAIVIAVFGILFATRRASAYRPVLLWGGSAAAALVGIFWFVERAFAL